MMALFSDRERHFWRFVCPADVYACRDLVTAREIVGAVLGTWQVTRPLVVTDAGVVELPLFGRLTAALGAVTVLVGVECDIRPVAESIAEGRCRGCDGVIAVGGGSVLDAAKLVAVGLAHDLPLDDPRALRQPPGCGVPLMAIPTTFGTGAEVNGIGHWRRGSRCGSMKHPAYAPRAALLITEIALAVPKALRFLGGIDALVHAVEAFTLKRETSPVQQAILSMSIKLLSDHLQAYVEAPDLSSSEAVATAAMLAGMGIHNSRTGLIHALAGPYAAFAGLPHAVSLLPFIRPAIAFNWPAMAPRLQPWVGAARWEDWLASWPDDGVARPPHRSDVEVSPAVIEEFVRACMRDRVLFKENPRPLSPADLRKLYQEALVNDHKPVN